MPAMEYAHPFSPVSNEAPALPDKFLDRVSKLLSQNCTKIDVEKRVGKKGWSQVNVITPTHDAGGNMLDDGYSIAVALYHAAEFDAEETGYETESYRGKFWVQDENGDTTRRVASFRVNAETREAIAQNNDDNDELSLLGHVLGEFRGLLQIQTAHIENQNARILQMSQDAHASTKPLLSLVETLVSHYHTGLNMQSSALQTIYDIERAGAVEQARESRNAKLLEILMLAAPKALEQFGAFAGNQVASGRGQAPQALPTAHAAGIARVRSASGGSVLGTQQAQQMPAGVQAAAAGGADPGNGQASVQQLTPEQQAQQEMRRRIEEAPLTTVAHNFRDSLSSIQWLDAAQALTRKQLAALKSACTGTDEISTADGVRELKDQILGAPKVMASLGEILDETQLKMVMALVQLLQEHDVKQSIASS